MNNLLTRMPTDLEVEEELRLHIDFLLRENIQRGMSPEEARAATLKRFGNLDRVKNECVEICRRSRPLQRAFKVCGVLLALTGLILRISSTQLHVGRIGTMLIAIATVSRLLLHVRSLTPSRFLPKNETSSFSILSQK